MKISLASSRVVRTAFVLLMLPLISMSASAQGHSDHGDRGRGHHGPDRGNNDRWVFLGERFVDGRADTDKLPVTVGGAFRAIQIRVSGGAVELTRVVVHFENGADTDLRIRDRIPAGGTTGAVDLPGKKRRIRSVEMWYTKARWARRPGVSVFALR